MLLQCVDVYWRRNDHYGNCGCDHRITRRQSTSRKSVKRQLSFTKLPAVDQNEASSGDDAQDWAHELHVRQADLQNQCP